VGLPLGAQLLLLLLLCCRLLCCRLLCCRLAAGPHDGPASAWARPRCRRHRRRQRPEHRQGQRQQAGQAAQELRAVAAVHQRRQQAVRLALLPLLCCRDGEADSRRLVLVQPKAVEQQQLELEVRWTPARPGRAPVLAALALCMLAPALWGVHLQQQPRSCVCGALVGQGRQQRAAGVQPGTGGPRCAGGHHRWGGRWGGLIVRCRLWSPRPWLRLWVRCRGVGHVDVQLHHGTCLGTGSKARMWVERRIKPLRPAGMSAATPALVGQA
jgi:hypothetical protein